MKFRAWDTRTKAMIKGHAYCVDFEGEVYSSFNKTNETRHFILMQSTGLADKNGVEIFEGDILCWQEQFADGDVDGYLAVATWRENCAAWVLKNKDMNDGIVDYVSIAEIIGNIHENPELISNPTPTERTRI